jgi:hypothetical protein
LVVDEAFVEISPLALYIFCVGERDVVPIY